MAKNTEELMVGVTGNILSAPLGTVIEYGVNGEIPNATDHGYATEDGVTVTGTRSTTNIYLWQEATLGRVVITEASVTYSLTLAQLNTENNELYYGSKVNATTGGTHWDVSKTGGKRQFVIDVIDPVTNKKRRYYLPSAEVTEVGEQTITNSGLLTLPLTITAYKVDVEGEACNTVIWEGEADEAIGS